MADFRLHLVWLGDGVGDFPPQQFAKPAAEPVQGHLERPDFHGEHCRQALVFPRSRFPGQVRLQPLKHGQPTPFGMFGAQIFHDPADECHRPAAFKRLVRRAGVFRLPREEFLGMGFVERNNDVCAAAFDGLNPVVVVVQKIGERC